LSAAERRSIDEVTQAIATTATLGTYQYAIVAIAAIPMASGIFPTETVWAIGP
jgi:hypothetical protein